MKKLIVVGSALIAACTTVSDLRDNTPAIQTSSSRSVQEISACIAQQWAARSGQTNMVPREHGVSMNLTYMVYSSALPAVVVDIDDSGSARSVLVYARKGDNGPKLKNEIKECV